MPDDVFIYFYYVRIKDEHSVECAMMGDKYTHTSAWSATHIDERTTTCDRFAIVFFVSFNRVAVIQCVCSDKIITNDKKSASVRCTSETLRANENISFISFCPWCVPHNTICSSKSWNEKNRQQIN